MNNQHTVTRTYDLQLTATETVHLRLTVAAQLRLKNRFKEDALDVILSASSDPERLLAVLDEALHFNDDPNGDLTGEALYDALVDSGVSGVDAFSSILFQLANVSGLLSDTQAEKLSAGIEKMVNAAFDGVEKSTESEDSRPLPFGSNYCTTEDMILEANAYGLSFSVILSMTYGELKRYILFHRDFEKRQYQNLSQIAYIQAGVIAAAIAGEDVGAVYDLFPYWTGDDVLDIQAAKAMAYFDQF